MISVLIWNCDVCFVWKRIYIFLFKKIGILCYSYCDHKLSFLLLVLYITEMYLQKIIIVHLLITQTVSDIVWYWYLERGSRPGICWPVTQHNMPFWKKDKDNGKAKEKVNYKARLEHKQYLVSCVKLSLLRINFLWKPTFNLKFAIGTKGVWSEFPLIYSCFRLKSHQSLSMI